MPEQVVLASQVVVKLNGTEVQRQVMNKLSRAVVDQHCHLPGMFELRFNDPQLELLNGNQFELAKEIEVLSETADGTKVSLIKGEITALEPVFGEGMIAELVVRGYDRSHRMFRETKSKAFVNIKDSDLASQIASSNGLQAEVDTTSTVYDHLFQHNQTDLELLFQRAWRIGYECFVSEGKLFFRKPPASPQSVTLRWGQDLLSFTPRMSLAEQVDEVVVRGWDPSKQQAIVGRASSGQLYPRIGDPKDGASHASSFGSGKKVVVDQPVVSQSEANILAEARLNEISGACIQAEGTAFRRPDIRAGRAVEIEALGTRFSGTYLVTSATHVFNSTGYRTVFTVRGIRTGLVTEQITGLDLVDRWPGVFTAVVTNTNDPQDAGRVKLKYPWMTEDAESGWARVIGLGAGPEAGSFLLPDVGDEVLVAFLHGDFNQPIVLGGLWSDKIKMPKEASSAAQGEKPLVRTWNSRKGHRIVLYDDSNKKIEIVTTDGRSITLSDQDSKIIIKTSGVELTLDDNNLEVKGNSNINLKSSGNMKLESSGNLDISASGNLTLKGAMVNIN